MSQINVFRLHTTGEYSPVEDVSLDNIEDFFKDEEVFIILYPDVRRLYIWQGKSAPVQKRFISSRVASKMQKENLRSTGMQHKIVAIDQGDELDEFVTNLSLKGVKTRAQRLEEKKKKEEEEARKFEELMAKPDILKEDKKPEQNAVKASSHLAKFMKKAAAMPNYGPVSNPGVQARSGLSDKEKQELLDLVLKEEVPAGFKREHLIMDGDLYVSMKKIGKVFDEEVEIETWDEFNGALKDGFKKIDNRQVRLLIDNKKIKAVEILKPEASPSEQQNETSAVEGTESISGQ